MTQRPERAIGEPVVVAVDVRLVEPDAAQRVFRVVRRNGDAPRFVCHLTIARPGPPSDPRAVRAAHRRVERGHETARRLLDVDPARPADVLVRLAVRDEYELAVGEIMSDVWHRS